MKVTARILMSATAMIALAAPAMAQIVVSDVEQFYRVYDSAHGKPTAAALQRDYLDVGSQGVRDFIPYRIKSAEFLESQIASKPDVYAEARHCMSAFPAIRERTPRLSSRLKALYPQATDARVTIVIGADNSGGTVSPESGVILGLEVTCENRTNSTESLDDRLTTILAHELIHTQQRAYAGDTLLATSLNEGVAELLAELTSGKMLNEHLKVWTKGKEAEIAARFRADMDKSDLSLWMYNNSTRPAGVPSDLGYWVGYRIAKSFYDRSVDKTAAVARLLEETDARALLRDSGW